MMGKPRDFFQDIRAGIHGFFSKKSKGPKKPLSANTKDAIFVALMLALPLLQIGVFYFGVNINSIMLAFKGYDSATSSFYWMGFGNFKTVFYDLFHMPALTTAAKNSLIMYAVGLFVSTPLNIIFAYCIYKKVPFYGFFRVILFLPSIISSVVLALVFKFFVEYGLPEILTKMGITNYPVFLRSPDVSFWVIILYGLWSGFGAALVLYTNAMSKIPEQLIEYGNLEGIGVFKEFTRVVLPLIFPTITTYVVIGIAGIFSAQGAIYIFYGAEAEQYMFTYGYYFFTKVVNSYGARSASADYPYAVAAGLIFTTVAAPITFFVKHLMEKYGPSAEF